MIETGWHANISMEEYHSSTETYSKSSIVKFEAQGALKFNYNRMHPSPRQRKSHFDVGEVTHTLTLEPNKYKSTVAIIPADEDGKPLHKNSKKYKEWEAANSEKAILSEAEESTAKRMSESILDNKIARELVRTENGIAELTGIWEHHTGLKIKIRPDYIPSPGVLVDLKTNQDDGRGFELKAYNLKYHWSAYLSTRGAEEITGIPHDYYFVVVDKEPPHETSVYLCPTELLEIAETELAPVIAELAECVKTGVWPGKPESVQTLGMPDFVKRRNFYR